MRWASENEHHPATFCSETVRPNWRRPGHAVYNTTLSQTIACPVAAERDQDGDGTCVNSTFGQVMANAANRTARLCTATELVLTCGMFSGCNSSTKMGWSSTVDPKCDATNPCFGVPTPAPTAAPTVAAHPPTSPSDCRAYKVTGGSLGAAAHSGDAAVASRHALTCCSDQAVSGWLQCGATPTGHGQVWAGRTGLEFKRARVALGYGLNQTIGGNGDTLTDGGAFLWLSRGCVNNVEWTLAAQICNAVVVNVSTNARARLCTDTEQSSNATVQGCGVTTGCGHGFRATWSSTPAANQTPGCTVPAFATTGIALRSPAPTLAPTALPTTRSPTHAPTTRFPTPHARTSAPVFTGLGPSASSSRSGTESKGSGPRLRCVDRARAILMVHVCFAWSQGSV